MILRLHLATRAIPNATPEQSPSHQFERLQRIVEPTSASTIANPVCSAAPSLHCHDAPLPSGNRGLVSIVVLNWNGGEEVLECLRHVAAQTWLRREIIVVDNGSRDGSLRAIRERHPEAIVCENGRNLGYAAGMNVGIRHASGEFLVLLNQDAFIEKTYLERAQRLFEQDPHVGMVAPTVYRCRPDEAPRATAGRGMAIRWHMRPIASSDATAGHLVLGSSFACAMIRREALEDIRCPVYGDYLDEDYFAYHDDVDLSFRIALRGWHTPYCPDLVVWHRQGSGTDGRVRTIQKPPFFQRHVFKNRYLTTIKDLPAATLLRAAPFIFMADVLMLAWLLLRSPRTLVSWALACTDVVRLLPKELARRRHIQSRRRVSSNWLEQFFVGP